MIHTFSRVTGPISAVLPDGGGGWYIGGGFTAVSRIARHRVAHIKADGSLDPSWNPDANGDVHALALSRDGTALYLGGSFTQVGGQTQRRLSAVDARTGTLISGWTDPNVNGTVSTLALSADGTTLYVGGSFTQIRSTSRNRVAAVSATTGALGAWNPNANGNVNALVVSQDGGTVYLGGNFTQVRATAQNRLGAVEADPNVAAPALRVCNPIPNNEVKAMLLAKDGATLYLGGVFTQVGTFVRNSIAKLNVPACTVDANFNSDASGGGESRVGALARSENGSTIYIGGDFATVHSVPRNNLAAVDATTGVPLSWNPDANDEVMALAVSSNAATVYAGGSFNSVGNRIRRNYVAALDTTTGIPTPWDPNAESSVYALAASEDGTTIYVGGTFTQLGRPLMPMKRLAAVDTVSGALIPTWTDPGVGNPSDAIVRALGLSPDGGAVYLGGQFNQVRGQTRRRLAAVDARTAALLPCDPNAGNEVDALAVSGDGRLLLIGGSFITVGGQVHNRLAAVDVNTMGVCVPRASCTPNANDDVKALAFSKKRNTLYAGGSFSQISGVGASHFAELDTTCTLTGCTPAANGDVNAIAQSADGQTVYIGGAFTSIGTEPRGNAAAFDVDSCSPTIWNPHATGGQGVSALAVSKDGRRVYMGGAFTRIGGESRSYFAAFGQATVTPTFTATPSATRTSTATATSTPTATATGTSTVTPCQTPLPCPTDSVLLCSDPARCVCECVPVTPTSAATRTDTPTVTRTPTATPTVTFTKSPTPCPTGTPCPPGMTKRCSESEPCACTCEPGVDLAADKLEVVQSVQDLNNTVPLVANKRTFVRFHVHSSGELASTTAQLRVRRGGDEVVLAPVNPGGTITVRPDPNRAVSEHAFLFQLPSGFEEGTVELIAELNPAGSPIESNLGNNTTRTTVTFEEVPEQTLVLYRVGYQQDDTVYFPDDADPTQLVFWLQRAFPLSDLRVIERSYVAGDQLPTCGEVNSYLLSKRFWDLAYAPDLPANTRYYGMVGDAGGFMPGCAAGVPSFVASGPSGTTGQIFTWDTDGSYGDFTGGHELAHTWGRPDAPFCGADGPDTFPNPDGRISPALDGEDAIFGFDSFTRAIYPPNFKDLMTFCPYQWVSDFTYKALLDFFQTENATVDREANRMDRLMVVGTIDPETNQVDLQPLFVLPNTGELRERVPGDYAIVLRGEDGNVLRDELGNERRYPFTPDTGAGADPERNVNVLFINELVPYDTRTTRVDIEGPSSSGQGIFRVFGGGGASEPLASISAGLAPPTVQVLSPTGGEVLSGETVTVSWTASDPDAGDALNFDIQYSPDGGTTWEMIEQNIPQDPSGTTSVEVDARNLVRGGGALFRVWATDGIHPAHADSGTASKPNQPPQVDIKKPEDRQLLLVGQTLQLIATAFDDETGGTMPAAQLRWLSDLAGSLGSGESLVVATCAAPPCPAESLGVGAHRITFEANDGQGGVSTDEVEVIIGKSCIGDCNLNAKVTVDELVTMLNIALSKTDIQKCFLGEQNWDGTIDITELIGGVDNALHGCR